MQKPRKLYCYVDETGQDTKGRLYIVVVVISPEDRERVLAELEVAEQKSGKGKRKWHHNTTRRRDAYIAEICRLNVHIYYQAFVGDDLTYELTTILATANAIRSYVQDYGISDYKATIIIDGLPRTTQRRAGKMLRSFGIKTKSVRGERDQSSAGIRLADAVAGLLRQALQGEKHVNASRKMLEKEGVLERLP